MFLITSKVCSVTRNLKDCDTSTHIPGRVVLLCNTLRCFQHKTIYRGVECALPCHRLQSREPERRSVGITRHQRFYELSILCSSVHHNLESHKGVVCFHRAALSLPNGNPQSRQTHFNAESPDIQIDIYRVFVWSLSGVAATFDLQELSH